ncbi:MAG: hypothetical protein GXP32_08520 [Kiritimatiellaeota bacterium]|nr:hypothetical protein [Kiritimatiellota bacterium]
MEKRKDKSSLATAKIPESLRRQMRGYELALYEAETALASALALAFLIISFLLLFGSDRLWSTPVPVRVFILLLGALPVLILGALWLRSWVFNRRGARDLAKEIQLHHREFGDRLLGAIELANGSHENEGVSEELMNAAIAKTAAKAKGLNFAKDVDKRRPGRIILLAVLLFAAVVAFWRFFPEACENTLERLLNPLASISRYTFTVLKPLPEKIVVPKNEPFELKCGIDPINSKYRPERLEFSIENVCDDSAPLGPDCDATLKIPGVLNPSSLEIRAGDALASVSIDPKPRPALKKLSAKIAYPEYTTLGVKTIRLNGSILESLIGALYSLEGEVIREIVSAEFTGPDGSTTYIPTDGTKFATPKTRADSQGKISITWKDEFGMVPTAPCSIEIRPVADRKPFVKCPGLAPFSAVLADEVLKITVRAKDDFGLRSVDAEYKVESVNGVETSNARTTTIPLVAGGPETAKLAGSFAFSPKLLGLKEKTLLSLWGIAGDFKPGRGTSRSAPHKIYILSREQHAKLVADRLKRVMADMEDMLRREEESLAKNKKISKLPNDKMKNPETAEKVRRQYEREAMEKRELDKLAAKTANMLKEALRNKKFPDEALRKWSEFLDKMRSMSKSDMPKMLGHLNKSAENSARRAKELAKAIKAQRAMLEKLKKMLKKMDDSLNSLELATFANRLKKQAKIEKNISSTLKRLTPKIIGLEVKSLPSAVRGEYKQVIARQKAADEDSREIRGDLSAFFSRTRLRPYKDVVDDMDKSKMDAKLVKLSTALKANHTGTGVKTSASLAKDFKRWAKMLSKSKNSKAGGGGGQGGGGGEVDMEMLLNILRMIQGEQNLREKTKVVDRSGKKNPKRAEHSEMLAKRQRELLEILSETMKKAGKRPKARAMLSKVGKTMAEVETLLKKTETGKQTVAAETEVVERLAGAFSQACEGGAGKQPGAATMMALMEMLMKRQMGTGMKPGGSMAGGNTNTANKQFGGTDFTGGKTSKTTGGAAGKTVGEIPDEFRSDIEAFLKLRRKQR